MTFWQFADGHPVAAVAIYGFSSLVIVVVAAILFGDRKPR